MAVNYIKYRIPFRDVNEKEYRVDIYGSIPSGTPPSPIILTAGESPLTIDEDDSRDFFAPIRTQTGNLTICTKIEQQDAMPDGGLLQVEDIAPSNNTERKVRVTELYYPTEGDPFWTSVWEGFISCEMYNQAYIGIPENISFPIISKLEAWKSIDYTENSKIMTVSNLISRLSSYASVHNANYTYIQAPRDGSDIMNMLINTSVFFDKVEYINQESHELRLKGPSLYDVLESICKFMGWTAREGEPYLYLELLQGKGTIVGTESIDMSNLNWRGANHQRTITTGKRRVQITATLKDMDVDMSIPDLPYEDFMYEQDQQIGDPLSSYKPWVYMLPSANDTAYSNITFNFYAGSILLGTNNVYQFNRVSATLSPYDIIQNSIPYANTLSQAYKAFMDSNAPTTIYAGAFLCRMEINAPDDHDLLHTDTKDGLFVSFFPGAWVQHTVYNQPIFEMRSVQAFSALEDGWFNLNALMKTFWAALEIGGRDTQCRLMFDLQVGNYVWTGTQWRTQSEYVEHFFPEYAVNAEGDKFKENWNASMGIDEVDGLCIPAFFTEDGVKKHVMGEVVLRIYPETRFFNRITSSDAWRNLVFGIFFEKLDLTYIPIKSVKRTNRSENKYLHFINSSFNEEVEVNVELASWLHNNPSPSLLYKQDGSEPMQKLTYIKPDNTTQQRRPEEDLLNRMDNYYNRARTILELRVEHLDNKPLPKLRMNGIGDGKAYAPMSESRDWQTNISTILCFETPEEPEES